MPFDIGGGQRFGDGRADLQDSLDTQTSLRNQLVQGLALDQLHGQEVQSSGFLDGVDGDDTRVVERGEGLRLALEALEALRA